MAKARNNKKTPRSSIPMPRIDAVPIPQRKKKRSATSARPPAALPEPVATYEI